jgi:hypothetical protein
LLTIQFGACKAATATTTSALVLHPAVKNTRSCRLATAASALTIVVIEGENCPAGISPPDSTFDTSMAKQACRSQFWQEVITARDI